MSDDSSKPTRPKLTTSHSIGVVRQRPSSPGPFGASVDAPDGRPPTKRARKAINCEPCRNSKLKCDRNRPCSSCVLRGTSALCYQDARVHEPSDSFGRDDHHRIDPAQEIARLRHSLNLLESHIFPYQHSIPSLPRRGSEGSNLIRKKEADLDDKTNLGVLASQGDGGLYAGPTSAATQLLLHAGVQPDRSSESRYQSQERGQEDFSAMPPEYDRDLLALLLPLETIDALVDYYFQDCNWIYRHVNERGFRKRWERFKAGSSSDRIVLATVSVIMAVALQYLPASNSLLNGFNESVDEVGHRFYDVARTALKRRMADSRTYNIELIELNLIRCHFQALSKKDSEEIWSVKGELITIGTAMGLHRDPGKFQLPRDVAERRRWAWWHIVLLERWQAFMFGRPISIASHHFDTQLPSYCDPAIDSTGRLYLPNIALFKLAYILGDIVDDAVSIRPVSYDSIMASDRALTQWMDSLPTELDLDDYRVARSLASPIPAVRRFGVQSVIIRTSYHHIRFTLHRPFASAPSKRTGVSGKQGQSPANTAQSLEIAVGAADKLITMVGQSRPDFLANTQLAVPGHMNWGPFHCFSAAMFFSFQLITNPTQPGAGLLRTNVSKAIAILEQSRSRVGESASALADKAYSILTTLAPLYSPELGSEAEAERDRRKAEVLSVVGKLAFPYMDSHSAHMNSPKTGSDSHSPAAATYNGVGEGQNASSPALSVNSNSPSVRATTGLPITMSQHPPAVQLQQEYDMSVSLDVKGLSSSSDREDFTSRYTISPTMPSYGTHIPHIPQRHHHQEQPQPSPHSPILARQTQLDPYSYDPPSSSNQTQHQYQQNTSPPTVFANLPRYNSFPVIPFDESTMWGASVGFNSEEWASFLDVMQRPENSHI